MLFKNDSDELKKTKPLYVILSEVELLRVERSEQAEAQGVAAAGSRNESRWLFKGMLHLLWQATKIRSEIPSSLSLLGFSSLFARKNFDSAQDDSLTVCLVIIG